MAGDVGNTRCLGFVTIFFSSLHLTEAKERKVTVAAL